MARVRRSGVAAIAALAIISPFATVGRAFAAGSASAGYGARATLSGPVTTGTVINPLSAHPLDLSQHGYVQQEFFASGTARAFTATAAPSDGRWSVTPTTSAEYRTRILVRRPSSASRFNGTVVVEWMNVSGGESAPDWDYLNPELMREGYAYVGVSAQALGVNGGTPLLGLPGSSGSGGLVNEEPERYGSLHHPGDQYAYDMYAQIGAALRSSTGAALGGLRPKHVIAVGESQSAFYLTTFANAFQPRSHAFDGIFIHSRGGGGAPLGGRSIAGSLSSGQRIRTDLAVPVFMFETQTDLIQLGYAQAQQPDTRRIRTWEVAGTSHADSFIVGGAAGALGCTTPVNDGPQHIVIQAAFVAFNRWVDGGVSPPSPPPFRLSSTQPPVLALDRYGNVIGGVRTPAVQVPISTLSGAPPPGASAICSLFGSTTPFTPARLQSLYGSTARYRAAYRASLSRAISNGFILPADRAALLAQAAQIDIPQ